MADTSGFAVGMLVEVSSKAGAEKATITVVHANVHITVNSLALNHTNTAPMVRIVCNHTFIVDTSVDLSTSIGVGNKVKFTDGTVKYFVVVAIAATRITLFGGTDYSIAGTAAVTSPYYSMVRTPFGFPLNPTNWTVDYIDTTSRNIANPAQNTWYNIDGIQLIIPIGIWHVSYQVGIGVDRGLTTGGENVYITLSTANNSESDAQYTGGFYITATANSEYHQHPIYRFKILNLTTKSIYYQNLRTTLTNQQDLYLNNGTEPNMIRAVCAYL
jgi:hypothetical protein